MTLGDRLRKLRRGQGLNQADMAKILKISRRSYGLYELNKCSPNATRLNSLAQHFNVSSDWLVTGTGDEESVSIYTNDPHLKVVGLAECGLNGWYQETKPMGLKVMRPHDLMDDTAFAVVATGTSLIPEGIKPGFICICSPDNAPENSDIVYILEKDGKAALKIFRSLIDGWLTVEGFLPPDETGNQQIYTEKRNMQLVETLATVAYIKRKL